jgi:hypothetical protein
MKIQYLLAIMHHLGQCLDEILYNFMIVNIITQQIYAKIHQLTNQEFWVEDKQCR